MVRPCDSAAWTRPPGSRTSPAGRQRCTMFTPCVAGPPTSAGSRRQAGRRPPSCAKYDDSTSCVGSLKYGVSSRPRAGGACVLAGQRGAPSSGTRRCNSPPRSRAPARADVAVRGLATMGEAGQQCLSGSRGWPVLSELARVSSPGICLTGRGSRGSERAEQPTPTHPSPTSPGLLYKIARPKREAEPAQPPASQQASKFSQSFPQSNSAASHEPGPQGSSKAHQAALSRLNKDKSGYLSLSELKEGCAKIRHHPRAKPRLFSQDGRGRCLRRRICPNRPASALASGVRMAVTALCDTSSAPPWLFCFLKKLAIFVFFFAPPVAAAAAACGRWQVLAVGGALRHHQGGRAATLAAAALLEARVQLLAEVVNLGAALGEAAAGELLVAARTGRLSRHHLQWVPPAEPLGQDVRVRALLRDGLEARLQAVVPHRQRRNGSNPSCRPQQVKYLKLLTSWPRFSLADCPTPREKAGTSIRQPTTSPWWHRLPNRSDSTCHFLACRAAGG
uniref:EF-hand domain-containing protein n=1 Tax=Macrostomum lignano TaxID=282301 RepID=A0A1I8JNQ7_9PLAT